MLTQLLQVELFSYYLPMSQTHVGKLQYIVHRSVFSNM